MCDGRLFADFRKGERRIGSVLFCSVSNDDDDDDNYAVAAVDCNKFFFPT